MQIKGHVAVVTGGGSGLGAGTARHLAGQGARVAIFDRDIDRAQAVAAEIGGRAYAVDVGDEASVAAAYEALVADFGEGPRAVVNCAGIGLAGRIVGREGKLAIDLFEKTVRVNLIGTYNVMSYGARLMQAMEPLDSGERGVIVNTASVAFEDGQVGQAAYSASKGGIAGMTLPAARDLGQWGIRVMAIAPGLFKTPMMEALPPEVSAAIEANIPFPSRLGLPSEYAQLAGDIIANPYLNGTLIRLDAAVRLPRR